MKRVVGQLVYSPTDLTRFFESEFACWMERYRVEMPKLMAFNADPVDEMQQILFQMGQAHEQRYLESLQQSGTDICMVERTDAWETTLDAMKSGRRYIYQAALQHENFVGYADMLVRIEEPSNLGDWSYIPLECKLAVNPKPLFIIQSCCYCDLLNGIQGNVPKNFICCWEMRKSNDFVQKITSTITASYVKSSCSSWQRFVLSLSLCQREMGMDVGVMKQNACCRS